MTQSKSQIKGSKGSIGGYPPHIYHHIFWQYVGQYAGPIFSWEKINEYFWYHPEIFLGVFALLLQVVQTPGPRISNPYCRNIQIQRCEWTQGKKMTQSKSQIKGSKGSVGGYPPHIYHHIFWQYAGPKDLGNPYFLAIFKLMNIFAITQKYS